LGAICTSSTDCGIDPFSLREWHRGYGNMRVRPQNKWTTLTFPIPVSTIEVAIAKNAPPYRATTGPPSIAPGRVERLPVFARQLKRAHRDVGSRVGKDVARWLACRGDTNPRTFSLAKNERALSGGVAPVCQPKWPISGRKSFGQTCRRRSQKQKKKKHGPKKNMYLFFSLIRKNLNKHPLFKTRVWRGVLSNFSFRWLSGFRGGGEFQIDCPQNKLLCPVPGGPDATAPARSHKRYLCPSASSKNKTPTGGSADSRHDGPRIYFSFELT